MSDVGFISTDTREIRSVTGGHGPGWGYFIGVDKVTKIVPYSEQGQAGWIPAFAIYRGDQLWARVTSSEYEVRYRLS
jgi:hypothetical protein